MDTLGYSTLGPSTEWARFYIACFICFLMIPSSMGNMTTEIPTYKLIDLNDPQIHQRLRIFNAWLECNETLSNVSPPNNGGLYCEPLWDDVMCWGKYVPAGATTRQLCPSYVFGFNSKKYASRRCTESGAWENHPDPNITDHYTEFSDCFKPSVPSIIRKHMPIIIKLSTIGYSISLGILLIATSILVCFKRLYCERNTVHINLFVSFILRAVLSILRNCLLVDGFALPSDISYSKDGSIIFDPDEYHWQCKLLNSLWYYALCANYFWIFVEGLYLHNLIFFSVFLQSKQIFSVYIIIGWVVPSVFIAVWVVVRILDDNTWCWNTHEKSHDWIFQAPTICTIFINFFFFLNITRVLFTKIRDCNSRDPRRYRKLAKSTLVLIPMFGVYYIVFILLEFFNKDPSVEVVTIYLEMTLSSLQGTVIAMLFCFLNGEVRGEFSKRWHRHHLRKQSVTSGRSSRGFSTGSTLFYRPSVSMGTMSSPLTSAGGDTAQLKVDGETDFCCRSEDDRQGTYVAQGELKFENQPQDNLYLECKVNDVPNIPRAPSVVYMGSGSETESVVKPRSLKNGDNANHMEYPGEFSTTSEQKEKIVTISDKDNKGDPTLSSQNYLCSPNKNGLNQTKCEPSSAFKNDKQVRKRVVLKDERKLKYSLPIDDTVDVLPLNKDEQECEPMLHQL